MHSKRQLNISMCLYVRTSVVMPRSHSGEGAMMISANIEEQRRLQIHQNSPKKAGKRSHMIKDLHTSRGE